MSFKTNLENINFMFVLTNGASSTLFSFVILSSFLYEIDTMKNKRGRKKQCVK